MTLPLIHQPKRFPKAPAKKAARRRSILVTVAVLIVLVTRVHIERDGAGAWHFVIDKPAVDAPILGTMVRKALGLPSGGQP